MSYAATVLVVEDDPALREALCDTLELAGYAVRAAGEGRAALRLLEQERVGMVVSDVQMAPMDGHKLLQKIRHRYPSIPVLLMTAYGSIEKAVSAMRDGAVDYLVKPFEPQVLVGKIERSLAQEAVASTGDAKEVVAEDLRTRDLLALAARVARSDATVLIGGESGTGKEVIAHHIHRNSERRDGAFVAINCAAIPDNMLEAVLFGYEKGAFTGALQSVPGKFEQAQGGTLLLDEISEMPLALQAKLLRVLQEREVERLGSRRTIRLDVRVLATSNRKLREEVAAGRFREDLFYRLNVFPLTLPALRERPADIVPLARALLLRHLRPDQQLPVLDPAAERALLGHRWPGNVRELENLIQRALILSDGVRIRAEDLCFEGDGGLAAAAPVTAGASDNRRLNDDLRSVEEQMILDALRDGSGSRKNAAEILGISERTLRYKIARMREAGVAIP